MGTATVSADGWEVAEGVAVRVPEGWARVTAPRALLTLAAPVPRTGFRSNIVVTAEPSDELVLSARSTPPLSWRDTMTSTDSVLWVDQIAHAATRLGRFVTVARIDGAVHDVFLSSRSARDDAFEVFERWMTRSVVPEHPLISQAKLPGAPEPSR
ncbi:hypothetical protein AB1K54_01875 [Microbacterium sp. BWT-B31]|uniref:hypothetical protein n=1 Tax=Microbacterium sp. BWT-B31 TaxID=3232072 RepID=UPI003527F05D